MFFEYRFGFSIINSMQQTLLFTCACNALVILVRSCNGRHTQYNAYERAIRTSRNSLSSPCLEMSKLALVSIACKVITSASLETSSTYMWIFIDPRIQKARLDMQMKRWILLKIILQHAWKSASNSSKTIEICSIKWVIIITKLHSVTGSLNKDISQSWTALHSAERRVVYKYE